MAYYITEAQFLQLQAIYSGTSATNYADIYDQIYAMIQEPDAFGTNVEGNVQAWFGAAADANRGVGGASTLIRTYTEVQLQTRYGGEISDIESVLQESSNSIADAVYVEIEASEITIDGQIYYVIPDAATIGATDALNALAPFEPYTDNAEAVWSGNILFTGL
ncbi:MAG: hypothetical protein JKY99_04565, partial [Rhizobiales bacterium]|nr:hypothetical protein [Hyphomicrobiales bacterium]